MPLRASGFAGSLRGLPPIFTSSASTMPPSFVSRFAISTRNACPIRQAVDWVTPTASASRTLEIPLSEWSCIQKPVSKARSASLVA
jgi:hypothetical protein